MQQLNAFQSTLPARGATIYQQRKNHRLPISIHAPRTGSDEQKRAAQKARYISIHAPRTGSDMTDAAAVAEGKDISIHAPRTGSDFEPR